MLTALLLVCGADLGLGRAAVVDAVALRRLWWFASMIGSTADSSSSALRARRPEEMPQL
jgi:hypothetical protein